MGQALYSAAFIGRTSFIVEGQRYFCLFDDAMITMRYADNWARGLGLVWNAGEPVEGYTSLLWTLILGLVHRLPVSPAGACLLVQILGAGILAACLAATAALAKACRLLPGTAICAVLLTAFHYNLIYFSLMGMETGLLTALTTFGLASSIRAAQQRKARLSSGVWWALAVLTRFDILPIAGMALLYQLYYARRDRSKTTAAAALVVAVLAAQFAWRHSYYGEWWPNTYYLKATGWPLLPRITAGIAQASWIVFSLGLPALFALGVLFRVRSYHLLLGGAFAWMLAYHMYVGGDAWPLNRFVIPVSCGLFVLTAAGIEHFVRTFVSPLTPARLLAGRAILTALCIAGLIGVHWDHALLIDRPQMVADNVWNVRLSRAVERTCDPSALLAVTYAGVVPYFSRHTCHDLLGKCDAHIAHLPVKEGETRAGHNKLDMEWSLYHVRPDVVLHAFRPDDAKLDAHYRPVRVEVDGVPLLMLIRRDSTLAHGGVDISTAEAEKLKTAQTP